MLQFFFRAASRLKPFRKAIILLIAVSALTAVYGFMASGIVPSFALQLGLSSTMFWALLLATVDIFRTVPPPAAVNASWWIRLKRLIIRGFYGALAILMIISALVLASTCFKLFSV